MKFADIHIHVLYGCDDGARSEKDMYAMIDASYAEGVRILCATPHFSPGYFGKNTELSEKAFEKLELYVRTQYPDMKVYLGHELRYSDNCISWLEEGICRTMNHTRFVLVDFDENAESRSIISGLEKLLNAGYIPILAHAERYRNLDWKLRDLRCIHENGVLIQMNTQSIFRFFGFKAQHRCKKMLTEHLVDLVSSDAHNMTGRPPAFADCFEYIKKHYGEEYAEKLCLTNACRMLDNTLGRKDMD